MRLLISCPHCRRRYDASQREVGTRFRCRCGEVLQVRQARGHTAQVVRCSCCGGARQGSARHCGYCNADFTLHERDLNTVCPHCFARVSDDARYCPQCATLLSGEDVAASESPAVCPVCEGPEKLASRRLGTENLSVLECQYCTGLWIGIDSFNDLRRRLIRQQTDPDTALFGSPQPRRLRRHAGPTYRKCIVCRKLMSRRQYAPGSGVIIDTCRDHGVWFDPDELHQVLSWIAAGGELQNPFTPLQPPCDPRSGSEQRADDRPSSATTHGDDFLDAVLNALLGQTW